MKILALDQASQTSGFAIIEDEHLLESGTFTFTGSLPQRLVKIRKKVQELIQLNNVNRVILEDIQLERGNVITYRALAEVIGVLQELLTELKIPHEFAPASSWRSRLRIKGTDRPTQKKNAQKFVKDTYNKDCSEDEADAICIGTYYFKEQKMASAF